jgi:defect-in-organelle-trafficking protein DotC
VENALQLKSTVKSISSQVVYRIKQDAQIISVPPNWRAYLDKHFQSIEDINPILLPKNSDEQKIWDVAIEKGWKVGVAQANRVFTANLSVLNRDYRGLCTYKMLALQDIIEVPMVAEGEYGVQIGNKTLDVDQRIFRITNTANFNEVEKWNPIGHIQKKLKN